eukprot:gene6686-10851_t
MSLTQDQIKSIKSDVDRLLKEEREEGGLLYVDQEDEDDLPWLDEFNFDEEKSQFTFTYDLTFEFEYEPCVIKIPTKYPKGEYEMKMGNDGDFILLLNPGEDFYQTLKNVFVEFNETRMAGLDSSLPQDSSATSGNQDPGDQFISQTFQNEYDDWLTECPSSRRKLKGTIKGPEVIKLKNIDIGMKTLTFTITGKDGNEKLDFDIYYADYLDDYGSQGLSLVKYDEKLSDFATIIKTFIKYFDGNPSLKDVLTKCCEVYQEAKRRSIHDVMKKPWYERANDEIIETISIYKKLWHPILKNELNDNELSTVYVAKKAILKQLDIIKGKDCTGFFVKPFGNNIFLWRVDLFGFQKESKSLHSDLAAYSKKYKTTESMTVEIYFTSNYPKEPPFVRVLSPRLQYLTGNVTFGGSFISVPALGETYSPVIDVYSIIQSVRQTLINGKARIDMKISQPYEKKVAMRAFVRERRNKIDSVGKLNQKFSILSDDRAKHLYGGSYINPMHPIENANNICLPTSLRDKLKPGTESGVVVLELKTSDGKIFNCGVLDYTAKNGHIIIPNWMKKHWMLTDDSLVDVRTVKIPLCKFLQFQPHSESFNKVDNVFYSLQQKLQYFFAITEGQTIPFLDTTSGKEFLLTLTATEPSSEVCVFLGNDVEFEVQIDFKSPLDSKDYIVQIENPEIDEEIEEEEWFEPDDEKIDSSTNSGLVGKRDDEINTGFLIGKRVDEKKPEVKKPVEEKPVENKGGNTTGGKTLGTTTDGTKCEICGTYIAEEDTNKFHLIKL